MFSNAISEPKANDCIAYIACETQGSTGCIKKNWTDMNLLSFRKTAISIQFFMYVTSLGTNNVE
jgi:uncharacterized protein YbdZ (MbtH family)